MSEKLFKDEYIEKEKENKKKGNFILLVVLYKKLNTFIMLLTIILNALIITIMLSDFNIGIMLFIMNQYLIVTYYLKVRKENKKVKI